MDVSNLTKKAFSLGKKYSALKESVEKLKNQQALFYTRNSKISADTAGHLKTVGFADELKEIDEMANSKSNHPPFVVEVENKLKTFETKLIERKINFHMQLMEYNCCVHNLTIQKK